MTKQVKTGILSVLGILILFGPLCAQQRIVEKKFSADPNESIQLNLRYGEKILITTSEENRVSFTAIVEINRGRLNDAFMIDFMDDEKGLRVDVDFDKQKLKDGRREDCPGHEYSYYTWSDDRDRAVCSRIIYQITVPPKADLNIETISGDIELLGLEGSIYAKSISGFVDLSWPVNSGAELAVKTVTGEAYTDLENISFKNRREKHPLVGYELKGTIGTGGPMVRLESVSGNIYLRKVDSLQ